MIPYIRIYCSETHTINTHPINMHPINTHPLLFDDIGQVMIFGRYRPSEDDIVHTTLLTIYSTYSVNTPINTPYQHSPSINTHPNPNPNPHTPTSSPTSPLPHSIEMHERWMSRYGAPGMARNVHKSIDFVRADEVNVLEYQASLQPEVQRLGRLLTLMDNLNIYNEDNKNIVMKAINIFDPNQDIMACACCGEAYALQRDDMTFYDRKLSSLELLLVNDEAREKYYALPPQYRPIVSIYPLDTKETDNKKLWHVHPQFVTPPLRDDDGGGLDIVDDHIANICRNCNDCLSGTNQKLPLFSLANKFDYGDITRLKDHQILYPPPTIGLRMAVSLAIPYCRIIQQTINKRPTGRFLLTTHCISFPFNGPAVLKQMDTTMLPRSEEEIKEFFKIVFVGIRKFKIIRSALLLGATHAVIDSQEVFNILSLFQHVNEEYHNITIPTSAANVPNYDGLRRLPTDIVEGAEEDIFEQPGELSDTAFLVINQRSTCCMHQEASRREGRDIANVRGDVNEATYEADEDPMEQQRKPDQERTNRGDDVRPTDDVDVEQPDEEEEEEQEESVEEAERDIVPVGGSGSGSASASAYAMEMEDDKLGMESSSTTEVALGIPHDAMLLAEDVVGAMDGGDNDDMNPMDLTHETDHLRYRPSLPIPVEHDNRYPYAGTNDQRRDNNHDLPEEGSMETDSDQSRKAKPYMVTFFP